MDDVIIKFYLFLVMEYSLRIDCALRCAVVWTLNDKSKTAQWWIRKF
jgi:hypothetical protein